jgi:carbohydrate-binding DOMON domain-containing protein
MKPKFTKSACLAVLCFIVFVGLAFGQEISFKDPTGDDDGPGKYTYPTDGVYKPGSFDITAASMKVSGDQANFAVSVNSKLEDPWGMKVGFAVQMIFIFIDTDHKEGSGFLTGLPGLNINFSPADAWDKVIVLSPQGPARVRQEADAKCGKMAPAVLIPKTTRGSGSTISGAVPLADIGSGDPKTWGYQVIMQSNEGFPDKADFLTRKVNEYEGQHRFGGGNDGDCDPQVMDILAPDAVGDRSEIDRQHEMLSTYDCDPDHPTNATLTMVHPKQ